MMLNIPQEAISLNVNTIDLNKVTLRDGDEVFTILEVVAGWQAFREQQRASQSVPAGCEISRTLSYGETYKHGPFTRTSEQDAAEANERTAHRVINVFGEREPTAAQGFGLSYGLSNIGIGDHVPRWTIPGQEGRFIREDHVALVIKERLERKQPTYAHVCFGYFDNTGFKHALWHDQTALQANETMTRGYFVPFDQVTEAFNTDVWTHTVRTALESFGRGDLFNLKDPQATIAGLLQAQVNGHLIDRMSLADEYRAVLTKCKDILNMTIDEDPRTVPEKLQALFESHKETAQIFEEIADKQQDLLDNEDASGAVVAYRQGRRNAFRAAARCLRGDPNFSDDGEAILVVEDIETQCWLTGGTIDTVLRGQGFTPTSVHRDFCGDWTLTTFTSKGPATVDIFKLRGMALMRRSSESNIYTVVQHPYLSKLQERVYSGNMNIVLGKADADLRWHEQEFVLDWRGVEVGIHGNRGYRADTPMGYITVMQSNKQWHVLKHVITDYVQEPEGDPFIALKNAEAAYIEAVKRAGAHL